ncbi:thyroid receptor-interacting protein 6 [Leucoraja erinacea]|uniref:thyroid receptor-interacting protein 6 n=1 Tax=Leucoraja erinaceus TaxID=7782 RepID=UPI00245429EF|nr:thyroid receptor-interacting protein 6 [Leucoraja erinacea]
MSGPSWHPPRTGAPPRQQCWVLPAEAAPPAPPSSPPDGALENGSPATRAVAQSGLASTSISEDYRMLRPSMTVASEHRYPAALGGREDGPHPPWSQAQPPLTHDSQARPPERTMARPSSIDAEIDSLTSMLADMQNNSPFQPRPRPSYDSGLSAGPAPYHSQPLPHPAPIPVPPKYKPLAQPPVTMTTKATGQPEAYSSSRPVAYGNGAYTTASVTRPYPQPVAASYTTASSSSGPPFNVQVKVAQPVPSYSQPGLQAEQAYGPPPPPRQAYGPPENRLPCPCYASGPPDQPPPSSSSSSPGWYPASHFPDAHYGPEPVYGPRRAEGAAYGVGPKPPGHFQQFSSKKGGYGEELPPPNTAHLHKATYGAPAGSQAQSSQPEEELDRITKKLVHDMNNPPSEEYFGRCARCGENVVGDGTGCVAMDQVFHVECFTCMTCRCRLRGRPFYAIDKKSYCESCYINTLEQCSVCSKPIMDRILRAMGRAYHPQCFTCVVCHRCLDGIPFTVDATSQIHCIEDFHMKFAPRCSLCARPIMPEAGQEETVRIVALDRSFHVNCYKCEDCGFVLSSDGEGSGCYPLDGHILCKSCSGRRIQQLSATVTTDC